MSIKAMKTALEALDWRFSNADAAIEALRQAIEQAEKWDTSDMAHRSGGLSVEQEPEAWMGITDNPYCDDADCNNPKGRAMRWHKKLLYLYKQEHAAPKREWVGLTEKEIFEADNAGQGLIEFARAIETKLKERNT